MVASGNDVPQQPQINARWLADDTGGNVHGYRVTFATICLAMQLMSNICTMAHLDFDVLQTWDIVDENRVLDLHLASLSWVMLSR